MISLRIELNDLAATQRLGTIIAHHLRAGDRLLLIGEVGSGKTTLARAIGSALLEVELTPGAHDDARGATLRIGDAARAKSMHTAVLAAGIEVADGS